MHRKMITTGLLFLLAAAIASADIPKTPIAERLTDLGTPMIDAEPSRSLCTVIYYNYCSGWIWLWSGFQAGDVIGVNFDLPNSDCSILPGEGCLHTGHFWYWRYTSPGYGFTVTYNLYDTDASGCLDGIGDGTGSVTVDPVERWNFTAGMGVTCSPVTALTAEFDKGTLPYAATDNNASNLNAGPVCMADPGTPGTGSSLQYIVAGTTVYCPPAAFADGVGYADLIAQAYFNCLHVECGSASEEASWGEIKGLFR